MNIPITEFKSVILEKWYPNTPNYDILEDIKEVHIKFGTNKYRRHLKSYEIVELFILQQKPTLFSQKDYENYIATYQKKLTPMERTPKQIATIVQQTITEINKHKKVTDEIISKICQKNKISESHIKKVGCY